MSCANDNNVVCWALTLCVALWGRQGSPLPDWRIFPSPGETVGCSCWPSLRTASAEESRKAQDYAPLTALGVKAQACPPNLGQLWKALSASVPPLGLHCGWLFTLPNSTSFSFLLHVLKRRVHPKTLLRDVLHLRVCFTGSPIHDT